MKLHHIRDIVAVAETGSLRSAARRLDIAQSAITRSIRELEHELGAMLFERRAKGVVLTPIGEAFVRRARGIQLDLDRAREEVAQLKGQAAGSVSIGLSSAPHIALLPRVVEPFRRRFPDVRLTVQEGLFPSLEADLQDGRLDFYVGPMTRDAQPVELLVEHLFENQRIIVARIGHPMGLAGSLADLAQAKWISSTFNADLELYPEFEAHGLPRPQIAATTETAFSMLSLVSSSDLLAMLPQQWVDVISDAGRIQQIRIRERLAAPPICLVRRARLPLTPAAEHLCDLFQRAALHHSRRLEGHAA